MSAIHIEASQYIHHPVRDVFSALKDDERFGDLVGLPITCLVEGAIPGGPGSVRRIGPPFLGPEETILEVRTDELIRYRISKNGGPIRNHEAQMRITPSGDGSTLTWVMDFQVPMVLALPIRAAFPSMLKLALRRIARGLEQS